MMPTDINIYFICAIFLDLLIAGDMIELGEVVEMATTFLIDQLDPSNAIGIYR